MIYFLLPIYNEEKNIKRLILGLRNLMQTREYKIIAVNDGSSDGSLKILESLKDEDLIIESYLINMNIGAVFSTALQRVLSESKDNNDILVILESDQTSELSIVDKLLVEIQEGKKDVVIASRYQEGGGYINFPFLRYIFSYCANFLLRKLFPINREVKDYTIFFRAYRVGVFYSLIEYFSSFGIIQTRGFIANSELLIKISLFTKKISEVPFVYDYGRKIGRSKMNIVYTISEYFEFICHMKTFIKKVTIAKERNGSLNHQENRRMISPEEVV